MPEPHYDFEKELSSLKTTPVQSSVGDTKKNPVYTPEPLPFTERVSWLIYLVLAASSVALGWILFSLARRTVGKEEECPICFSVSIHCSNCRFKTSGPVASNNSAIGNGPTS
jgi:hypothetical protein